MSLNKVLSFGAAGVLCFLLIFGTGCTSRKSVCSSNNQYSVKKHKKNKSAYNVRYEYKSKPVKKSYVIRNKR